MQAGIILRFNLSSVKIAKIIKQKTTKHSGLDVENTASGRLVQPISAAILKNQSLPYNPVSSLPSIYWDIFTTVRKWKYPRFSLTNEPK